jgi:hypothetical protein
LRGGSGAGGSGVGGVGVGGEVGPGTGAGLSARAICAGPGATSSTAIPCSCGSGIDRASVNKAPMPSSATCSPAESISHLFRRLSGRARGKALSFPSL